jgi:hypothetical protein
MLLRSRWRPAVCSHRLELLGVREFPTRTLAFPLGELCRCRLQRFSVRHARLDLGHCSQQRYFAASARQWIAELHTRSLQDAESRRENRNLTRTSHNDAGRRGQRRHHNFRWGGSDDSLDTDGGIRHPHIRCVLVG